MHITWDKAWELPGGNESFPDRLFCNTPNIKLKRTTQTEQNVTILHFSRRALITQAQATKAASAFPELGLRLTATEKKLDVSMIKAVLDPKHAMRLLDAIVGELASVIKAEAEARKVRQTTPVGNAHSKPRYVNRSRH